MSELRAPFPWFGGKSKVSHLVWERFGPVPNYVEPFAGSLAVLLGRPDPARIETVNDLDCYLANFWRAVQADPVAVATCADWPVNEADLHARHLWLVQREEFRERMKTEPEFFDVKIAGWWVWGICQWIGSGWCARPEWRGRGLVSAKARGVAAAERNPRNAGLQVWRKRPSLRRGEHGMLGEGLPTRKQPAAAGGLTGVLARGIQGGGTPKQQVPDLGGNGGAAGRGVHASAKEEGAIVEWMLALEERLRRVRVCCGDWQRVLGRCSTECIGVTGVFLDPPYGDAKRDTGCYVEDSLTVAGDVSRWARANGENPKLRIALCGYEGEHDLPGWECVAWKANGGYGNAGNGRGRENAGRERIWFSPHCLAPAAPELGLVI